VFALSARVMSIPYITVISSPEKAAPLTLMRLAL
jgi:hypothetical protein